MLRAEDNVYVSDCPKIAMLFWKFFDSYLTSLPSKECKVFFLEEFTSNINNYTWNGSCLMLLCNALKEMSESASELINPTIISNIK
jgi:hypothetical protein